MRRTPLFIGLAVAVVTVLIVAGVLLSQDNVEEPIVEPESPERTALLIPGYGGGTGQLERLASELDDQGIQAEVIDIGEGTDDLRGYADLVQIRAEELISQGEPAPDLIGYSAGGVTARAAFSDNPELYGRVITLASPHQGTSTAVLGELVDACPVACQQLQPGSELIESFPEPERPDDWLSIWSEDDIVIRPATSSEISDITNYRIQAACDVRDIDHGAVPVDPQVEATIVAFLEDKPLPKSCVPEEAAGTQ